ncbi:MAG: hypothetical protein GY847_05155 [Proteobacteria bacterium]|nr:hypothetical protein [Pseudomonadota bacterium]
MHVSRSLLLLSFGSRDRYVAGGLGAFDKLASGLALLQANRRFVLVGGDGGEFLGGEGRSQWLLLCGRIGYAGTFGYLKEHF